MRCLALLLLISSPALADDRPVLDPVLAETPGAVALYLQAHQLAALGAGQKDPLLVLSAVRILHGLHLTDTARQPDPALAAPLPLAAQDDTALLDRARQLDAGQNYSDLIDMLTREVPPHPHGIAATSATLAPGKTQVWTLAFFGGGHSELAILGQGESNLDLLVTGPGDTHICLDKGNADAAFCGFALVENGDVQVTVTNVGASPAHYLLLTE